MKLSSFYWTINCWPTDKRFEVILFNSFSVCTGIFNLLPAVGTIRDLNESFDSAAPETPTESDQSDIPTESGDTNDN